MPDATTTSPEAQASFALLQQGCHAYNADYETSYGYVPSRAAGIVFVLLFVIPMVYHIVTAVRLRGRATTSILLAIGSLTEVIGWASRLYAASCPYNRDAFISQIVTLIIAPVFFSAALYVLLRRFIIHLGPASSIISARLYTIVFCLCDFVSLVIQAIGGAKASGADTKEGQDQGTHIMVAGIAFQLVTMTIFGVLGADFLRRVGSRRAGLRDGVTKGMQLVLVAILVSFTMIYIRSIYRTIELAQGWRGNLITHEPYFLVLDATIMVIAVAVFVPIDPELIWRGLKTPGWGTQRKSEASSSDMEGGMGLNQVNMQHK